MHGRAAAYVMSCDSANLLQAMPIRQGDTQGHIVRLADPFEGTLSEGLQENLLVFIHRKLN